MIARKDRTAAMPFIMLTTLIDMMSIGLITDPLPLVNTNLAVQLGLFYSYLPFMVLPIYLTRTAHALIGNNVFFFAKRMGF